MNPPRAGWSILNTALLTASNMLVLAQPLAAQPTADYGTRAAARSLGQEGIEAYLAADYATANPKLDKAFQLVATPTLGLWSARSRMQLGLWVEAAERYREALRAPSTVGDRAAQEQAHKDAAKELDELSARIPAVTLELAGTDTAGVTLSLDGVSIPSALLGVRRPMNPGVHHFVATRGSERGQAQVRLGEKEHKLVTLTLTAAQAQPAVSATSAPMTELPSPSAVAAQSGAVQGTAVAASVGPSSGDAAHLLQPLGIGAMALGAASLAAGGLTALLAQGQCSGGRCETGSHQRSYDTLRTVSTVTFWGGAALAAGGAVAWIVAPGAKPERAGGMSWTIGPLGMSVQGAL